MKNSTKTAMLSTRVIEPMKNGLLQGHSFSGTESPFRFFWTASKLRNIHFVDRPPNRGCS
jgi:hypothetical protein